MATCKTCLPTFEIDYSQVCRCPIGTFYEAAVDACVACTLSNCQNCLDRDICLVCDIGFKVAHEGRVCQEKTAVDINNFPDGDSKSNSDGSATESEADQKEMMFKTIGISGGTVILILLFFVACFCWYRIHRKKTKVKKAVDDLSKSKR